MKNRYPFSIFNSITWPIMVAQMLPYELVTMARKDPVVLFEHVLALAAYFAAGWGEKDSSAWLVGFYCMGVLVTLTAWWPMLRRPQPYILAGLFGGLMRLCTYSTPGQALIGICGFLFVVQLLTNLFGGKEKLDD